MPGEFKFRILNVVASVRFGKQIAIEKLMKTSKQKSKNHNAVSGVIYHTEEPKAAVMISPSGLVTCTGTKNINDAKTAIRIAITRMQDAGIPVPQKYIVNIEDITAVILLKNILNLEEISFSLKDSSFDPSRIPGLVWRPDKTISFILQANGKIICNGARSIGSIENALYKLKTDLENIGIKIKPKE